MVGGRLVELAILAGRKAGLRKGPEECGGGAVYRNITTRSPRQIQLVFEDFQIPRLTWTITCSIDLQKAAMETAVKRVYHTLLYLPNVVGFKTLFPLVLHISFVFRWTGVVRNSAIPICVRYHWHLSRIPPGIYRETRLDVYIIVKDSRRLRYSTLLPSMETLRQLGVLRNFESLF